MSILVGVTIALGIIAVAFLGLAIGIYNNLVSLRQQVERAWANIDVILKQRFDEIPQLIEIAEQFVKYEKGVLERLIEARKNYGAAKSVDDKIDAAKKMSGAIQGIFALGEAYPELKSNTQFLQLQTRVSALENQLSDRRELYNETVTNLNTRIAQIPDTFFAGMLGYHPVKLFNVDPAEKARPSLKINTAA
jgi:LemA protein